MKLNNPFEELSRLRRRIKASDHKRSFSKELDELAEIRFELEHQGIEVKKSEIELIGPFISYQGVQAVLYIFDSRISIEDLSVKTVAQKAPRFHLTWCRTLENMERRGRFARYILSRRKDNCFDVLATERMPYLISKWGKSHEMKDVRLWVCRNCLDFIHYKDFRFKKMAQPQRDSTVQDFKTREFLDENEATLNTIKFYKTQYSDINKPTFDYTDDWPEISRKRREEENWVCSECHINLSTMKKGLHVHHKNGVKSDNSPSNLRVLCALCHRDVDPSHSKMHVFPDIERYIKKNQEFRKAG
jgi:hypothetical protein